MASAGIECHGKVPVRTFAEKPAHQNYDMKPVQLAKTHNSPVVEPKNCQITPDRCPKTCPKHRVNGDTQLLYKRQLQQICTRCNRDKSNCTPASKQPEGCEPYQPIQLVLPSQPQRQMQSQNQMKSQNQMHPINQMQPQSQMHTQKGQLKSRNVQIANQNYNSNPINPSPSQVCGCDFRSQPQRPVQDVASNLSERQTCDLEHLANLQDVCEAYQSQIQCKDTIWTVKIMKDAANTTQFTNNPVMVQTSMTTIINASKLENLLPSNERFFVDEVDDYIQEEVISNAFVDCKPCIMYAEKGIPAIAPRRKQSCTKSRSKSRSNTSDKGCCFCCRRKKRRKKKYDESCCMQQPKDCTERYIS